jgi:pyruvate/2-oxoglutarate dehydrogenase complex dihydrolipoamide dehydrogenase (E3) component
MSLRRSRTDHEPDVLVIGGGAGGMAAARAAARRGASVLLVQQGPLGGDCTFTGCVPSKAVIEAAASGASFRDAMAAAAAAVETIAATEDDDVLGGEGVDVLHGWARFVGPRRIDVDGTVFRPRHVVIATGAGPAVPQIPGLDGVDHLTNETVFGLDRAPSSLVVLGGGAIGCELAQAMQRLGVAVTLIEGLDRLLPREEPEASAVVAAALQREGVDVVVGSKVVRVDAHDDDKRRARVQLDDGTTVDAERILVAVGRRAATEGLGLEEVGVATDRGFVVTTDTLATSVRGVWAVGDVAGKLQLTHAADEMGRIAIGNALSHLPARRFRPEWIPWVTFTEPEVARIGLSEAESAEAGGRVAYLPMSELDRAIAARATDGFVKLVAAPRRVIGNAGGGRLVGTTVVAARGGEMIAEAALAVRTGMFVGRLAQTVHAYPTWSTAVRLAAAQYFMEVGGRRARPAVAD